MKVETSEIITDVLGSTLDLRLTAQGYPGVLPPDLARWYCYARGTGHSILCVLHQSFVEGGGTEISSHDIDNALIHVPVKAVLRGGYDRFQVDGPVGDPYDGEIIVVKGQRYDPEQGLTTLPTEMQL